MESQRFVYYLKLRDGRLLYAEGESWQDASRSAGIAQHLVKRSMPVRRVLTEKEKAERKERIQKLKKT